MTNPKPRNDVVSSLWFKYHTTLESTLMQDATALQIAMRNLLRDRYWLTDCKPLGPVAIKNIRRRMEARNARDVITDDEVEELLSPEFGFQKEVGPDGELVGYHMPDLAAQRGVMLEARVAEAERKRGQRIKQLASPASPRSAAPQQDDDDNEAAPSGGSGMVSAGDLVAMAGGDESDF